MLKLQENWTVVHFVKEETAIFAARSQLSLNNVVQREHNVGLNARKPVSQGLRYMWTLHEKTLS